MTFSNEEVASILDVIIVSSSLGDSQGEFVPEVQSMVTQIVMMQSHVHQTLVNSEEAILRIHTFR